jgi:acylphosphatase
MERRAIAVLGIVQGVGFRPFAYGLTSRLELRGFVKNWSGGVWIEVEGEALALDRFLEELGRESTAEEPMIEPHAMHPAKVLRLAATLGNPVRHILIVGCEPGPAGEEEMQMEMSEPVRSAVDEAVSVVGSLVAKLLTSHTPAPSTSTFRLSERAWLLVRRRYENDD